MEGLVLYNFVWIHVFVVDFFGLKTNVFFGGKFFLYFWWMMELFFWSSCV